MEKRILRLEDEFWRIRTDTGEPSGPFTGVPYLLKDIGPLYAGTVTTLGSSAFRNFIPDHDSEMVTSEDVETVTWGTAEYARKFSASDYAEAINTVHRTGCRVISRFFIGYDVLLTPTMCTPPHKLGVVSMMTTDIDAYFQAVGGDSAFTSPFNVSGNPAMSVPLHWSPEGLPIGVQFVAPFGDEATLSRLATQLETAQPWANRRPVQSL